MKYVIVAFNEMGINIRSSTFYSEVALSLELLRYGDMLSNNEIHKFHAFIDSSEDLKDMTEEEFASFETSEDVK